MSKVISLSVLKQGIQRLREKGSADPSSLFDLLNGYVTIDGSTKQRPGTEFVATLPAGTHGLIAHRGEQVVFSIAPKTMPAGFRCEVVNSPGNPTIDIRKVWFAAPFLGEIYSSIEFNDGTVSHFWLEGSAGNKAWQANHAYTVGEMVVPGNGLAYRATRLDSAGAPWKALEPRTMGDVVEATTFNGYTYEVTAVGGAVPKSGSVEPTWPTTSGALVTEQAALDPPAATTPTTGGTGSTGGGGSYPDPYCVAASMFLDDGTRALAAKAGDEHTTHDPVAEFARTAIVAVGRPVMRPCVKLTTTGGAVLVCSESTPFTHADALTDAKEHTSLAPEMLGREVIVDRYGVNFIETVAEVVAVGEQLVVPIDFGGLSFPAGQDEDALIFSHNVQKGPNNPYGAIP